MKRIPRVFTSPRATNSWKQQKQQPCLVLMDRIATTATAATNHSHSSLFVQRWSTTTTTTTTTDGSTTTTTTFPNEHRQGSRHMPSSSKGSRRRRGFDRRYKSQHRSDARQQQQQQQQHPNQFRDRGSNQNPYPVNNRVGNSIVFNNRTAEHQAPTGTNVNDQNQNAGTMPSTVPDLSDLIEAFSALRVEGNELDDLESYPLVEASSLSLNKKQHKSPEYLNRCRHLLDKTVTWIDQVKQLFVQDPSSRSSLELNGLLGQSLTILNKIPSDVMAMAAADETSSSGTGTSRSLTSHSQSVLALLRSNEKGRVLLKPGFYNLAIRIAIREQNWEVASGLFWGQIDPDSPTCAPVHVNVNDPIGLYAIARYTQKRGGAVAEQVMDAVNQLILLSPKDQDTYVLAAGTALGYANAWESLLNYLRTSFNSPNYGETLVSATMHACIVCNQHEQALKAFNGRFGLSTSRQIGEVLRLSPLCRDLAMRASLDTDDQTTYTRAYQYFQEARQQRVSVSLEALLGVARACESTEHWDDAVGLLFSILDHGLESNWIVPGFRLSIAPVIQGPGNDKEGDKSATTIIAPAASPWWLQRLAPVLASTVRSCIAEGHFATGLLCVKLFELAFFPQNQVPHQSERGHIMADDGAGRGNDADFTMFHLVEQMEHNDELLASIMTALCGLGYYHRATTLFARSRSSRGLDASNETVVKFSRHLDPRSAEIYLFAISKSKTTSTEPQSFIQIWGGLHRFVTAIRALELDGGIVPENQEVTLANELADVMRTCTAAGYPDVAICLARRTERMKLSAGQQSRSAFANLVDSFFVTTDSTLFSDFVFTHDASLAEYIKSYSLNGWHDAAIGLFETYVNQHKDSLTAWPLSCNAAMEVYYNMDKPSDAVTIVRNLGSGCNVDTFCILGRTLARNEHWKQLCGLYITVGEKGLFSQELALLTMEAIFRSSEEPLDSLCRVVSDAANHRGLTEERWLRANYWALSKTIGCETLPRLMGWDDPNTQVVAEVRLAIEALEDQSLMLTNGRDIAWMVVSNVIDLTSRSETLRTVPGMEFMPTHAQEWIDLVMRVTSSAIEYGLLSEGPLFTKVLRALKVLAGDKEIVELINYALSNGWKLDCETLTEIQAVMEDIDDSAKPRDIEFLSNWALHQPSIS